MTAMGEVGEGGLRVCEAEIVAPDGIARAAGEGRHGTGSNLNNYVGRFYILAETDLLDTDHLSFAVMGLVAVGGELFFRCTGFAIDHRQTVVVLPVSSAVNAFDRRTHAVGIDMSVLLPTVLEDEDYLSHVMPGYLLDFCSGGSIDRRFVLNHCFVVQQQCGRSAGKRHSHVDGGVRVGTLLDTHDLHQFAGIDGAGSKGFEINAYRAHFLQCTLHAAASSVTAFLGRHINRHFVHPKRSCMGVAGTPRTADPVERFGLSADECRLPDLLLGPMLEITKRQQLDAFLGFCPECYERQG